MRSKTMLIGIGVVIGVLLSTAVVLAGSLNPTVGPTAAGSQMYTLQQIYDRLDSGATTSKMTEFTEPTTGPGITMHTLDDIYALALPARVPKTGQTTSYAAGDDGAFQKGVAWPNPRFITGTTGVVTDTLTGLIWLQNANCTETVGGIVKSSGTLSWTNALTWANALASGSCGLTDGSAAGDWRLPNMREMQSLVHYGFRSPAVPNTVGTAKWTEGDSFTGVQSNYYWTSTTGAVSTSYAWYVYLYYADVNISGKTNTNYVWPVRGGQ